MHFGRKCTYIFFPTAGTQNIDLGQLLRPKAVTILLWRRLICGHHYPLSRDGQFYIHALPGIRTQYLRCSSWLPLPTTPVGQLVVKKVIFLFKFHILILNHEQKTVNLTSTLTKIQILEIFCNISCYEFGILKNGVQYRDKYLAG